MFSLIPAASKGVTPIKPLKFFSFIYLFLVALGLCYFLAFSPVVRSRGYSLVRVCGLLLVVASLAAGQRL